MSECFSVAPAWPAIFLGALLGEMLLVPCRAPWGVPLWCAGTASRWVPCALILLRRSQDRREVLGDEQAPPVGFPVSLAGSLASGVGRLCRLGLTLVSHAPHPAALSAAELLLLH